MGKSISNHRRRSIGKQLKYRKRFLTVNITLYGFRIFQKYFIPSAVHYDVHAEPLQIGDVLLTRKNTTNVIHDLRTLAGPLAIVFWLLHYIIYDYVGITYAAIIMMIAAGVIIVAVTIRSVFFVHIIKVPVPVDMSWCWHIA